MSKHQEHLLQHNQIRNIILGLEVVMRRKTPKSKKQKWFNQKSVRVEQRAAASQANIIINGIFICINGSSFYLQRFNPLNLYPFISSYIISHLLASFISFFCSMIFQQSVCKTKSINFKWLTFSLESKVVICHPTNNSSMKEDELGDFFFFRNLVIIVVPFLVPLS